MPSGGANKFTYEQVKNIFEKHGFKLLSKSYISNGTKMKAICPCGTDIEIRLSDVQRGHKCQKCGADTISNKLKKSDESIKEFCESKNCKLIRSWIKNKKTRIEYICKCGNQSEAYWSNFSRYPNCKKCGSAKVSGANCYMYDSDREAVALRKKFRKICGQHIRRFMNSTGQKKTKSTHELLGYKPQDLQNHILNHQDFKSCVGKIWHVDHIFPIKAFLDHGILDLKTINRLDNLRPVLGVENLSKADKYDKNEFLEWLNNEHKNRR
jgi:hypothetical protein